MRNRQPRKIMDKVQVQQTRNLSRDMAELEAVYEGILNEKFAVDELNDNPNRGLQKNTGPEAADNFEEAKIDSKTMSEDEQEENAYKVNSQNYEKNPEKQLKERVNNSIMEPTDFDKLFNTVMEGGEFEDFGAEDDQDSDDELGGYGDEDEDDDGGDVTIKLSSAQVDALRDILSQVDGEPDEDEDPIEDEEDDVDEEDMPFPEGTEYHDARPQPDTTGKVTSKGHMKVQGRASQVDSGSTTGAEGKQEALKNAPDGKGKLQGKNNKVGKPQGVFAR
jgi:hypothetical protein